MATTIAAMWVHGNTVTVQQPGGGESASVTVINSSDGSRSDGDVFLDRGPLQKVAATPWTSIGGYRKGHGCTFRGKAGKSNDFYFSIPTPVLIPVFHPDSGNYDNPWGTRVRLGRIWVVSNRIPDNEWAIVDTSQVVVNEIAVWDGMRGPLILNPENSPVTTNGWDVIDSTGGHPEAVYGLCISVRVRFLVETEIEFNAAGADFLLEVP